MFVSHTDNSVYYAVTRAARLLSRRGHMTRPLSLLRGLLQEDGTPRH